MYTDIVVLLDGSQVAEVALPYVALLVYSTGAEHVTLLRVIEQADSEYNRAADLYLVQRAEDLRRTWDHGLCPTPQIGKTVLTAGGDGVAHVVVAFAAEQESSVIMLATHGWSGADWRSSGTVGERVVKRATVPVFVVRPAGGRHPRPGSFKKILVPLDGSQLAEGALGHAESLATGSPAAIELVYVDETTRQAEPVQAPAVQGEPGSDMTEYLNATSVRLRNAGIEAVSTTRYGVVGTQIAEAAKQGNFDLVVMSSHGRSNLGRGAFGGVTDSVIHGCHVPVLVVPASVV